MRMLVAVWVLVLAASAAAQDTPPRDRADRRAPLANVEDLEPAVDVGETRVAIITPARAQPPQPTGTESQSATAQPAPPAPAPTSAAPPAPSASSPQERPAPRVMDSLDLGTTSITGNAELPKVLYIVPWKKSDLGDLVGRPVNTLLDEVLTPVDPEVFQRHLSYYETLHGASQ